MDTQMIVTAEQAEQVAAHVTTPALERAFVLILTANIERQQHRITGFYNKQARIEDEPTDRAIIMEVLEELIEDAFSEQGKLRKIRDQYVA